MLEQTTLRYRLIEKIGQGGMGVVYRALDRLTGQIVALKRVTAPTTDLQFSHADDTMDARHALAVEFRTLAGLRHPYIVSVLDYGFDHERQPYFTMQLIEQARTLIDCDFAFSDKVRLLVDVLQALAYLHRRKIIHRDLKPGNVLLTADGVVKVTDFGLVLNQTQSISSSKGGAVGTLAYMAPELFMEETATVQSDLYAFGVMAYELLTGNHPFNNKNMALLVNSVLNDEPTLTALDSPVAEVIQRLLLKDPEQRYPDAETVIMALSEAGGLPVPEESAALRDSFLQAADFVGREQEFALLRESLTNIEHGWLIGGESGVGKSRLLDELRTQALIEGVPVLYGQAVSEGGTPYHIWREPLRMLSLVAQINVEDIPILKRIAPDIDSLLNTHTPESPAQTPQERLFVALQTLLQQQPVMVILEDLQWADSESLALLKHLQAQKLLIVGSYRDDEAPTLPEQFPDMRPLKLERLDYDSILALSESMLGVVGTLPEVVELLEQETEGNIFFIIEVVRTLAEEAGQLTRIGDMTLPRQVFAGGMKTVVRRRLERIPAADYPLLQRAAVAGRYLDLTLMRHFQPNLESWLLSCASAAVLEVQNEQWRFTHDKLREGVLEALRTEEHRVLHRQIAEALEHCYPDNATYAAVLAYHYGAAGDDERELRFATVAGDYAQNIFAYEDAIKNYRRAIELSGRTDLYLKLGRALEIKGHFNEALETYQKLETAALERQDTAMEAAAVARLGVLHSIVSDVHDEKQARAYIERGLKLARQNNEEKLEADLLWAQLVVENHYGEAKAAQEAGERSVLLARKHGMEERLAFALHDLGMQFRFEGNYEKGTPYAAEARELFRKLGNLSMLSDSVILEGFFALLHAEFETGLRCAREGMEIGIKTNNLWCRAYAGMGVGLTFFHQGLWKQAEPALQVSIKLSEQVGFALGHGFGPLLLADIYRERGDLQMALEIHQASYHFAQNTMPFLLKLVAAELALDYFAMGEIEQGVHWTDVSKTHTQLGGIARTILPVPPVTAIVTSAQYTGQWAAAEQEVLATIDYVRQRETPLYMPLMLYEQARCCIGLGKLAEAEAILQEAITIPHDRPTLWRLYALLAKLQKSGTMKTAARARIDALAAQIEHPETFLREAYGWLEAGF